MTHSSTTGCGCTAASSIVGTPAQTQTTEFRIENMDCHDEEALIRNHVGSIEGIHGLAFDLKQRRLSITHSLRSLFVVEATLNSIGMPAQRVPDGR